MTDDSAAQVDFTDLEPKRTGGGHLSVEQSEAIERYVARVLLKLELNYWRVYVAVDEPPEGCLLMIEPTDGRRVAMLYVCADWWDDRGRTEKRIDITHECLHLAHHDQEEVIRRFKRDNGDVGPYAMSIVWDQFKVETERMVDSLSYILAPHMPEWRTS